MKITALLPGLRGARLRRNPIAKLLNEPIGTIIAVRDVDGGVEVEFEVTDEGKVALARLGIIDTP